MERLDAIIKYINEDKIVADIGTDHGITAIKIYEEKSPKKVIATDISENSLKKLNDKLEYSKYNILTKVCDGIKDLDKLIDEDLDQIIISGMGGYLIKNIIEDGIDVAKRCESLILQANNSNEYLRRFLHQNNFNIIDESICFESGVYYNIIVTRYNNEVEKYNNETEYIYGKINLERKDELFLDYLNEEKNRINLLINSLKNIDSHNTKKRILDLEKELKIIEEIL